MPTTESDNPIGAIQEYCQKNGLPFPSSSFTPVDEGFRCTVEGFEMKASAITMAKKKAKAEAAGALLGMLHRLSLNKNEKIGADQECQGQIN
jgi:hypothetical protein